MQAAQRQWTSLDQMALAHEQARQRVLRVAMALRGHDVPYAIAGGHAVAYHVAKIDEGRVRGTPDVDVLVRRDSLASIVRALGSESFEPMPDTDCSRFRDLTTSSKLVSVDLIFENEPIPPGGGISAVTLSDALEGDCFRVLTLEALVGCKLARNRCKDRMHISDLMNAGLIDESWPKKYLSPLAERLWETLNDPNERQPI